MIYQCYLHHIIIIYFIGTLSRNSLNVGIGLGRWGHKLVPVATLASLGLSSPHGHPGYINAIFITYTSNEPLLKHRGNKIRIFKASSSNDLVVVPRIIITILGSQKLISFLAYSKCEKIWLFNLIREVFCFVDVISLDRMIVGATAQSGCRRCKASFHKVNISPH